MDSPRLREDTFPLIAVTGTAATVCIQVCGEVDLSNRDKLHAALAAVDLDAAHEVHLDLRGLTFCDVAGCRLLLLFEREARRSGHQTDVLGATSTVQKVMRYLANGDEPSFV